MLRRGLEAGHSSVVLVNPTSTDMQTLAFGLFKHQDLDGAPDLPVLGGPGALIQRNELA